MAQNKILRKNFRSAKEIVNFNNDFFELVAEKIEDKEYQTLYSEKSNNINSKERVMFKLNQLKKEEMKK